MHKSPVQPHRGSSAGVRAQAHLSIIPSERDILVSWMIERDRIRVAKAAGVPRPWTTDPLLRDYRWCNVRRMDDRVSMEMLARWYEPHGDPEVNLIAAVLGRLVNWPESLMAVTGGEPFHRSHLVHARSRLAHRASMGLKVFTGAYVVPGVPGRNKVDSVCDLVDVVAARADRILGRSMAATWSNLIEVDGLGSFLAGQMVADLAHLSAGAQWKDPGTWAPIGPGSARGLNRLLGRPKDKPVSQPQFERELPQVMSALHPLVQPLWDERHLQAMDIQNVLCEFDKARRLSLNEGTVRARYDGLGTPQETLL